MLEKVKLALRIVTTAFDSELTDLIKAGLDDLGVAGVDSDVLNSAESYPLITQAVITYVKYHFGEPADPDRLLKSYEMQKGMLANATGYTVWTGAGSCH